MKMLKRLAQAAAKYGLTPEEIGPISTFSDDDYMTNYLGSMKGWETPSFYGCGAKHRERARQTWDKAIAKVKMNANNPKSTRAPKPTTQQKARRLANVAQPEPLLGDQEPEDGFDMAILSPGETGLPFYVFILEDMGLIPDVRVEVAHSTRGSRSETLKVAIRPAVRVTSGSLEAAEFTLLTSWIELNRDVLIKYWDGEIEDTEEVLHILRPIETA